MERIKQLRKEKALTMKQLGVAIGVAESTISLYENGKRQPDNETLSKLADFFGVSVDYLLGRENSLSLDKQLEGIDFALYGETRDLTDEEKEDILSYIKFKKSQREK